MKWAACLRPTASHDTPHVQCNSYKSQLGVKRYIVQWDNPSVPFLGSSFNVKTTSSSYKTVAIHASLLGRSLELIVVSPSGSSSVFFLEQLGVFPSQTSRLFIYKGSGLVMESTEMLKPDSKACLSEDGKMDERDFSADIWAIQLPPQGYSRWKSHHGTGFNTKSLAISSHGGVSSENSDASLLQVNPSYRWVAEIFHHWTNMKHKQSSLAATIRGKRTLISQFMAKKPQLLCNHDIIKLSLKSC